MHLADNTRLEFLYGNNVFIIIILSSFFFFEEISGNMDEIELGGNYVNSRAYVSWFGFKSAQQQQRVSNLSGGERNRVQLAKLLKSGANLIILDEPTK